MKLFKYISLTLLVAFCCACEHSLPSTSESLSLKIEEVTLSTVKVSVETAPATSYFINVFKASSFKGVTRDRIVSSLASQVENGSTWGSLLKFGPATYEFDGLTYGEDYIVVAFGLRGDGTASTEMISEEVRTDSFAADIKLLSVDAFSFSASIKPSKEDFGYFVTTLDGAYYNSASATLACKNVLYSVSAQQGFDEIANFGESAFAGSIQPEKDMTVAVVAIDRECRPISDVFTLVVEGNREGLSMFAEDSNDAVYVGVWGYGKDRFGSAFRLVDTNINAFVYPMDEVNSVSAELYGTDLYTATTEEIEACVVKILQLAYDTFISEYGMYYVGVPARDRLYYSQAAIHTSQFETYGTYWYSMFRKDVESSYTHGAPVSGYVSIICLVDIDENEKVYVLPGTVAVARYDFKTYFE